VQEQAGTDAVTNGQNDEITASGATAEEPFRYRHSVSVVLELHRYTEFSAKHRAYLHVLPSEDGRVRAYTGRAVDQATQGQARSGDVVGRRPRFQHNLAHRSCDGRHHSGRAEVG